MDPHPSGFDDPQCTGDGTGLQERQEVSQPVEDSLKGCCGPNLQDGYSSALFRWKSWDLTEIAIEGDKCSSLGRANLEQLLVADAAERLIPHGHHIVPRCAEKLQAAASYI